MTEELKTKEAKTICKHCNKRHAQEGKVCYYRADDVDGYEKEYCTRIEDIDILIAKLLKKE